MSAGRPHTPFDNPGCAHLVGERRHMVVHHNNISRSCSDNTVQSHRVNVKTQSKISSPVTYRLISICRTPVDKALSRSWRDEYCSAIGAKGGPASERGAERATTTIVPSLGVLRRICGLLYITDIQWVFRAKVGISPVCLDGGYPALGVGTCVVSTDLKLFGKG